MLQAEVMKYGKATVKKMEKVKLDSFKILINF